MHERAPSWSARPCGRADRRRDAPQRERADAGAAARRLLDLRAAARDRTRTDPEGWAEDVDVLLAERAAARARPTVALPVAALGRAGSWSWPPTRPVSPPALRRPLPLPPNPHARRGTAFHAWLEQRFGAAQLLDLDELPGAADEGAASDDALAELQEAFLASAWADRRPVEAEVPFETVIAGVGVRGRMDAVFADPDGGYTVVDWKTGPAARRTPRLPALAVQLAAYRLAWAALAGVPAGAGARGVPLRRARRHAPPRRPPRRRRPARAAGVGPYAADTARRSLVIVFQLRAVTGTPSFSVTAGAPRRPSGHHW